MAIGAHLAAGFVARRAAADRDSPYASRPGQRRWWACRMAAQSSSSRGSMERMRSASSARRQRPEVSSGQVRPVRRAGPWQWRMSFPAVRRPASGAVSNHPCCSTRTRRPVAAAGRAGHPARRGDLQAGHGVALHGLGQRPPVGCQQVQHPGVAEVEDRAQPPDPGRGRAFRECAQQEAAQPSALVAVQDGQRQLSRPVPDGHVPGFRGQPPRPGRWPGGRGGDDAHRPRHVNAGQPGHQAGCRLAGQEPAAEGVPRQLGEQPRDGGDVCWPGLAQPDGPPVRQVPAATHHHERTVRAPRPAATGTNGPAIGIERRAARHQSDSRCECSGSGQ